MCPAFNVSITSKKSFQFWLSEDPLHSPRIEKVDVVSRGKVRRAKLYYLRQRSGKAARLYGEDGPGGN